MKKAEDLKIFLYLGVTTLYASLLENLVNIIAKSSILKGFGVDYLGFYQVSIGITIVYVGFITGSISNDYYPRLIYKIKEGCVATNSFVNSQISISMHLIMPLLLIFLAYGSFFIKILFSRDFLPAEELMVYSITGTLFRVISWPIVYVFLAHKNKKIYFFSEFIGNFSHLMLIILAVFWHSFQWLGIAYLIHYIIYIIYVITVYFSHFNGEIESNNVIFFLINISVIVLLVMGKLYIVSYAFTVAPVLILFMLYMGREEYKFILQSIFAKLIKTR